MCNSKQHETITIYWLFNFRILLESDALCFSERRFAELPAMQLKNLEIRISPKLWLLSQDNRLTRMSSSSASSEITSIEAVQNTVRWLPNDKNSLQRAGVLCMAVKIIQHFTQIPKAVALGFKRPPRLHLWMNCLASSVIWSVMSQKGNLSAFPTKISLHDEHPDLSKWAWTNAPAM